MYNILFFTHSQKRHGLKKKIKSNQKETAALPLTDVFLVLRFTEVQTNGLQGRRA